MYLVSFPIGDPSGDGHGKYDIFTVESNKTVQELASIHEKCSQVLGFNIEDICCDYEEYSIAPSILAKLLEVSLIGDDDSIKEELIEKAAELNIDLTGKTITKDIIEEVLDQDNYLDVLDANFMIHLWLDILVYLDPTLKVSIKNSDIPSIYRYVSCPGYGVYSCG